MDAGAARVRLALLIVASLALYLVGNGSVSLWDRDEPRYAQCSRQMLQSGDYIVPRLYDQPRTAKPPFIYWCQVASMRVLGDTAFAARLPSALAMALTLIVLARLLWRRVGPAIALWTTFILASSVLTIVAAKSCLTDSVLLLWIVIAQACLFALSRGNGSWPVTLTLGVAVGLAGLTKGPVVIGVMGATFLALGALSLLDHVLARRRARDAQGVDVEPHRNVDPLETRRAPFDIDRTSPADAPTSYPKTWSLAGAIIKSLVAVAIVAAIVAPWMYLIEKQSPGYLGITLRHDVLKRIATGLEGHKGPPGYHLLTIWATFLPWSLLLPLALVLAWKNRSDPMVRFALAAVIGPWLMFEIVQTKLPHYLLPVFPPLAFLTASALVRASRAPQGDLLKPGFMRAVAAWAIVIALVGLLPWIFARWFHPLPWAAMTILSLAALAWATIVFQLFRTRRPAWAAAAMGIGMLAMTALLFTIYLPRAQFLRLSMRTAEVLHREGATEPGEVIMLDYKEPSLAFYQGGTIREDKATALPDVLPARWPRWLVTTGEVWDQAPPGARAALEQVDRFHGLAYADSARVLDVVILRRR